MRFYIERLGCPKNDTDAEGMSQLLVQAGYVPVADEREADIVIVNTCGFIDSARDESLEYLRHYAKAKRRRANHGRLAVEARAPRLQVNGTRRRPDVCTPAGAHPQNEAHASRQVLVAAGCFGESSASALATEIPELDGVIGTQRWSEIPALLDEILQGQRPLRVGKGRAVVSVPRISNAPSAYVKIADGCSVGCAFCAIPRIKGPHVSKPVDEVVSEVRQLADAGVKEVILIAQNTAAYGHDLGEKEGLALLMERIVDQVPDVPWIRIMYAYPEHITDRLIETIANNHQIVKYLDVPLQHAHPDVVRRMRRPVCDARPLIAKMRESIPQVALRSAFIVGHPGESEKEFENLLSFLEEVELDRVGVFQYSAEEGTLAASLPGQVNSRVKQRRQQRAMELLREISARKAQGLLGTALEVLVEGTVERSNPGDNREPGEGQGAKRKPAGHRKPSADALTFLSAGRSYRDAPEVDGLVFLKQAAPVGALVRATITGAGEYDLYGEVVQVLG